MLGLSLCLVVLASSASAACAAYGYRRDDFPSDFVFGAGSSAYQVEGAASEYGRTPSIWDTFAHAGNYKHGANGDMACDQYHKYKEDVQLMMEIGLDAYRFSISWSRLIPNGRGAVNPKGLQYYNNLINELIRHGIAPHVTLHHSDLPQALEDEYGGWVSRKIVKDFVAYADVCFREFGDRVLLWTTLNEANVFTMGGYDHGFFPPQRCSFPFGPKNCSRGNSSSEPYLAAHNMLLAHASAVRLYRRNYQGKQHGSVGLNLFSFGYIPLTNTTDDIIATQRANDFLIGWFLDPLVFGDYPAIMKKNAGSRIPAFTSSESKLVKGSFDFLALNYYYVVHVKDNIKALETDIRDYSSDMAIEMNFNIASGIEDHARGLQKVLEYLKQAYGNPLIYIHETGRATPRKSSLEDWPRVKYLQESIEVMLESVRNGSNTRGYFVWSFLDGLELLDGYESSYGLFYVDLDDANLKRSPKLSAHWFSRFLKHDTIKEDEVIELQQNISALSHLRNVS